MILHDHNREFLLIIPEFFNDRNVHFYLIINNSPQTECNRKLSCCNISGNILLTRLGGSQSKEDEAWRRLLCTFNGSMFLSLDKYNNDESIGLLLYFHLNTHIHKIRILCTCLSNLLAFPFFQKNIQMITTKNQIGNGTMFLSTDNYAHTTLSTLPIILQI